MQEGANLAMPVWDNVFLLCCYHLTQFPPCRHYSCWRKTSVA